MLRTYAQFRPTDFDSHIPLEDREDWLVAPVSQTRDSGPLDRSNFRSALNMLGGESDTVEVHRFGHWGPGWFEILLVHPARRQEAEALARGLEDYPVIDDMDYSQEEWDECEKTWQHMDRKAYLRRNMRKGHHALRTLVDALRGDWSAACELLDCPSDILA